MGQVLHGSATTTHAVPSRDTAIGSFDPGARPATRTEPQDGAQGRERDFVQDAPMGPKPCRSPEGRCARRRRHTDAREIPEVKIVPAPALARTHPKRTYALRGDDRFWSFAARAGRLVMAVGPTLDEPSPDGQPRR